MCVANILKLQPLVCKKTRSARKTAPGLFAKRKDLTRVNKTPKPLLRPYTGARNPCDTTTGITTTEGPNQPLVYRHLDLLHENNIVVFKIKSVYIPSI
jgi:hypothetical protein